MAVYLDQEVVPEANNKEQIEGKIRNFPVMPTDVVQATWRAWSL